MAGANVFSLAERARIRFHLGYPSVQQINTIMLGFVAVTQPLYLVEKAMDNVLDESVPIVRELVLRLDDINAQMDEARRRRKASKLGELTLNENELFDLKVEYKYWSQALADQLACPINAYAGRQNMTGLAPISNPVIH